MGIAWLKTGAASAAVAEQEEANFQAQKEQYGKLYRFWIKEKEEVKITFIDGDLSEDGRLLPPRYYEHNLQIGGKWGNTYVCPEKTAPEMSYKCPICADGDRPALVALFTIIDHRKFPSKDGTKAYENQRRLLVAKPGTMDQLTKIAVKRGGLAGATFDVARMGEQSAAVGSMFDFAEKNDVEFLKGQFMVEHENPKTKKKEQVTYFVPADYETEIVFRTPEELLKLGLGKSHGGHSPGGQASTTNYANKL